MRSGLYAINSTTRTTLSVGQAYPLTTVVRRYGNNINLNNNAVELTGSGYYMIESVVNVVSTADGEITVALFKDGVPIPGATTTVSASAVGDYVAIPVNAIVRLSCCNGSSTITVVPQTAVTSNMLSVSARKL